MVGWFVKTGQFTELLGYIKGKQNHIAFFTSELAPALNSHDLKGVPIVPIKRIRQNGIVFNSAILCLSSDTYRFIKDAGPCFTGIGRWHRKNNSSVSSSPLLMREDESFHMVFGATTSPIEAFVARTRPSLGIIAAFSGEIGFDSLLRVSLDGKLKLQRIGTLKQVIGGIKVLKHYQNVITEMALPSSTPYLKEDLFVREHGTENIGRIISGNLQKGSLLIYPPEFSLSKPIIDILSPIIEENPRDFNIEAPKLTISSFPVDIKHPEAVQITACSSSIFSADNQQMLISEIDAICLH